MEFLQIGEAKLKIVMNEEDLAKYGLSASQDGGSPSCRRAIWQVLDIAKREVGFDPAGDKILVQFYPTKGAGCELFITKLGILAPSSARMVSKSDKVTMLSRKYSFYSFSTLFDLVSAVRAVISQAGDTQPKSDVYVDSVGRYILSVEEYGHGGEAAEFPCITEFGRALTADIFPYITEHFTKLTDGDGIAKFCQ